MKKLWNIMYNFFDDIVYKYKRRRLLRELKKRDPFIY
jgi:hypothetical protein